MMNTRIEELLNRLRTNSNRAALKAVDELRAQGWLTDGSLQGVAMCKAPLQGANLSNANLCCAGLHQAHLEWADLSGAALRATKLSLCNLSGANLKDAKLENADFFKANLRGVQNLTDDQLRQTARLLGSTLPNGERYDGRFSLFGDLALAEWNNVDTSDSRAMAEFYGVSLESYTQGQLEKVPV
jgi:uncharacterized protein YjbI with pentapeptide repeats